MEKAMFDDYAEQYDQWFMANQNVFLSELALVQASLKDADVTQVLSVGCGTGLFEEYLHRKYGLPLFSGVEPSADMAAIARKRGLDVTMGTAETVSLTADAYDTIYFNGSSSYIKDLKTAYQNVLPALKSGGKFILFDVPKESAYCLLYMLAKQVKSYQSPLLAGTLPRVPYPLPLVESGYWYTTAYKINLLQNELNLHDIKTLQTLRANPVYTNDAVEDPVEGYTSGGYVAIVATK